MATRVKLVVSHRHNARTQVKMAQVDGCTFFRRETTEIDRDTKQKITTSFWKHVDKSCKRIFHWLWTAVIRIGECDLVLQNGSLTHKDGPCATVNEYFEAKIKADEALKTVDQEKDAAKKAELEATIEKFGKMEKPICLAQPSLYEIVVGGCRFTLEGDTFKHCHVIDEHDNEMSRCKLREHYQDFGDQLIRRIRLTRKPGWDLEAFSKAAVPAIEKAVTQMPANPHEHIVVDVE